jgi:mycofactocin system transcriptional regulator
VSWRRDQPGGEPNFVTRCQYSTRYRHVVTKTSAGPGRPPGTTARQLEVIALRLFTEQGYEDVTVADIAAAAGVSTRTFFRYFASKVDVLWSAFDQEIATLRTALGEIPAQVPMLEGIRQAVLRVNHYAARDVPELRDRIALINNVSALRDSAGSRYDAWERCVINFAAARLNQRPDDLLPRSIGMATLAVCRAGYTCWVERADADLTAYLDIALAAMSHGFTPTDQHA